ncbi:GldG family protein [Tsuneonella sp. YG55]|uniref:GldG family protein n=1 Tax=Tsuneonella litorea TaxID=2976475 RepID=A0A9X2W3G5_9SPHN|nr:GldG family protein [Tsuneonella litorea]MCT2560151.1 GldG family protein [Tsuneonella litorea]
MGPRVRLAAAGLFAALLGAGIVGQILPDAPAPGDKPPLGLFTSLPIYWAESADIADALDAGANGGHWARVALERDNRLVPLDTLDGLELKRLGRLVMAQPRPLAPVENVALDNWVRGGGRLLLFADPFLTEHSRFVLGDRRRPQGMVLLSPILKRWGLELRFDEGQGQGERSETVDGMTIPIDMAGTLAPAEPGAPSDCTIATGGLLATCRIGAGEVTVVADAALLDRDRDARTGVPVLAQLVDRAFD